MKRKELSIAKMLEVLNAEGFNARQKKSAAKFVAQFNGYESARANEGTEWEGNSVIIIETSGRYWDKIVFIWEDKKWICNQFLNEQQYYTPSNVIKYSNRREARDYEDKLVYYSRMGERIMNRAINKFYVTKSNELDKEARRLRQLARELELKSREVYRKTW